MPAGPVRVFLVDDHDVVRTGLRSLLESDPDVVVVGEAATVAQAIASIPTAQPDVTLLDLRLPDGSGVEVCRELRGDAGNDAGADGGGHGRFVVLTSADHDEGLLAAVMAGADGYILKHVKGPNLLEAIHRVARGLPLLDPRARARLVDRLRRSAEHPAALGLSSQEERVFDLLADGLTNREIGAHLGLAEKTVKNYVSNLLAKLGLHSRTEAAVQATRLREQAQQRKPAYAGNPVRY